MKRNVLLYLLLLIAETLFASEDNNTLMLRQKPTKELPIPLVIGNKAISQKKLLALSDEQQKKLNEMSHPDSISRCFGMSDQVISYENVKILNKMPDSIKKGMEVKVLRVNNSCCINEPPIPIDAWAGRAALSTFVLSGLGGFAFCMSMFFTTNCPWSYCMIPIAVVPPVCAAACGECSNCIYHRYCVEREIYKYDDSKEISSE